MAYDIGQSNGGSADSARRLLALADHLETIRDQDYDHRIWRRRRADGGWTMCALGHAITGLPEVIGLRWRAPDSSDVVRIDGSGFTEAPLTLAAEAFGLTADEARMIFGVGLYTVSFYGPSAVFTATPSDVAAAIRAFALSRLALQLYPVGADGVSEVA
jgi:hypothetical protein